MAVNGRPPTTSISRPVQATTGFSPDEIGAGGSGRQVSVAGLYAAPSSVSCPRPEPMLRPPRLLLADEPTSQLDHASGERVVELLADAANDGVTVLVVTHDPAVAERMSRTVTMRDGRIISDTEPGPGDPR